MFGILYLDDVDALCIAVFVVDIFVVDVKVNPIIIRTRNSRLRFVFCRYFFIYLLRVDFWAFFGYERVITADGIGFSLLVR